MVKYYEEFLRRRNFSFEDAVRIVGSRSGALSILSEYTKKGYISKVRRGLYVAMDFATKSPVLDRYEVAALLEDDAVVSHHSAFSYYGFANQVSYCMYVSTKQRFRPFSFEGYDYMKVRSTIGKGISRKGRVVVTDMERTVLDCIYDFSLCLGFEEFTKCISSLPGLLEDRIIDYLPEYGSDFMFQKTGFIFERFGESLGLGRSVLNFCRERIGTVRALLPEYDERGMELSSNWNLLVPRNLWKHTMKYEEDYYEL